MATVWIVLVSLVCIQFVSGGTIVNIALNKPVSQSSKASSAFGPEKAVDGDNIAVYPGGIIDTGTGNPLPIKAWWKVDLQTVVETDAVEVYFRTNYKNRRNGLRLYTSTSPFTTYPEGQLCHNVTGRADGTDINSLQSVICLGRWGYLMAYTDTNNDGQGAVLDFGEVRVLVCSDESYGTNCDKSCSFRQCAVTPTSCGRFSAACPPGGCKSGWNGTDCTQQCISGHYGRNCYRDCNSRQCAGTSTSCDIYTGACPGGCKAGWNGTDCTQECLSGTYGVNCSRLCDDRKCAVTTTSCDRYNGLCLPGGCEAGWMGNDCAQRCNNGTYGANCMKSCSARQCRTPSTCDSANGQCPDGCQGGWRGEDCTQQCTANTFAVGAICMSCSKRHCQEQSECSGDGTCSGGCLDGWTLGNCTQACPSGMYGRSCSSTCGKCADSELCDPVDGKCPGDCLAGWQPRICNKECHGTRYGVNCREDCGMCQDLCNKENGHCQGGCLDGYNGTLCKIDILAQMKRDSGDSVMPAVAGTVAGLAVIVIIIIIIIVYKRRSKRPKGNLEENTSNHISNTDNVYINVDPSEKSGKEEGPSLHGKSDVRPQSQKQSLLIDDPEFEEEILEEDVIPVNRDYYNDSADVIREIPVGDLAATVQKINCQEGGFEAEFSRLPTGFSASYADSQKPENTGKNKYRGYYPYDHNRVHLSLLPDVPGSDYINASLMHSYNQRKTYIAAQAPNKKTLGDFWRMIWEQRCQWVIMLTNLTEDMRRKCYQYWPDKKGILETDQYRIEGKVTNTRANYSIRHLKVTSKKSGECRSVVQYHFTSWPDHGVPDTLALVHFIWMIRQTDTQTDGPLLVHCSAGIGRTGTYIAVDSLLDQARGEGVVDVLGYVSLMRGQRKNMIQTKEQYECVFHCLVDMSKFGNTSMDLDTFTTTYSNRDMDILVDRKTLRELTQLVIHEDYKENVDRYRMWVNGKQDFIVRVGPSLTQSRGYLMSVIPPSGREKLLWKLVEENNVHNVIVISQLQTDLVGEKGKTNKYDGITLKTTGQTNLTSDLVQLTLRLQMKATGYSHNVKMLKLGCDFTMDDVSSCLLKQAHLHNLSAEMSPVVVLYSETDEKLAVFFCIMGNILSGILQDRCVDVIGHVRSILKCCPSVTITEQELEKLFYFAKDCVQLTERSKTYANV